MDTDQNYIDTIKDPVELRKYKTAIEIMQSIVESGMTVDDACQHAGISPRTYYRWVEEGIFKVVMGGVITQAVHDTQLKVIDSLPSVIEKQIDLATGKAQGTNFDIHNAAKFLFERILDPAIQVHLAQMQPEQEEEEDPAQKYLEEMGDLPPGEKVQVTETTTRIVERQIPDAVIPAEPQVEDDGQTLESGGPDELPGVASEASSP